MLQLRVSELQLLPHATEDAAYAVTELPLLIVPPHGREHGATVVTLQVPEVVPPTVTVAVTAVLLLPEEVSRMAIVAPLLTPVTGPAVKAAPLMEMAEHAPPQVAVRLVKPPASVTVLLVVRVLTETPV